MSKNLKKGKILEDFVKKALSRVYEEQRYLIEKKVHERSIVFWFGVYFYEILKDSEFKEYNLDFEYNKNFNKPKRTKHFKRGTQPDIILHKRGSNEDNLLVIEFKTAWRRNRQNFDRDIAKLIDFIKPDGEYRYKYGMFIVLGENKFSLKRFQW